MLVKLNVEKQYCLNMPRLPAELCDRKNKALLIGQFCSVLKEEQNSCILEIQTDFETRVEVQTDMDLIAQLKPRPGDHLVIDGEFKTYYRKMRMYRPLIRICACHMLKFEAEEAEGGTVYPNRVYIEGVVSDNPVILTLANGQQSVRATVRSAGTEIPCCIQSSAAEMTRIQKGTHCRMWGSVSTRVYQKRLGKGRFETDKMNEITISGFALAEEHENKATDITLANGRPSSAGSG